PAEGLHEFVGGFIRYVVHVEGYLLLVANPYPGFYLFETGGYPIDVELPPPGRQSRWVTGFRLFLAAPAILLSGAFIGGPGGGSGSYRFGFGAAGTAAFLTWFFALATGRAPRGARDVAAWALGYSAHASAYLLLLTDR